ncbi:MAG: zinc metallopeptidase [Clostridia bacterium]|nr:zinc metallopeptidase [Clostridia bacterium]
MGAELVLYIAAIAAMLLAVAAQIKVKTTFNKYSRVPTRSGRTAYEVAEMILRSNGIFDVRIERVSGSLTDHYDPRSKVLRLSDTVYQSTSAAAVGVAAHEAGHAVQYARGYFPVKLRSALVPAASLSSRFTWILLMAGIAIMILGNTVIGFYVAIGGIALFALATLFELVTLPCEFDASRRAMAALGSSGWFAPDELRGSRRVLTAAALTYVAALAVSAIHLLRLLLYVVRIAGRGNRR